MAINIKQYQKTDSNRVSNVTRTQDMIEIEAIAADGTFKIADGKYTRSYRFSDVNYEMKSEDEKVTFIMKYVAVLNKLSVPYKLTFINRARDKEAFEGQVYIPQDKENRDNLDYLRTDINSIISLKAQEGRQGIEQDMYVTMTAERDDYDSAKSYFISLENQIMQAYQTIGSVVEPLDCKSRLKILYDFYRYGDDIPFQFDFDDMVLNGRDFFNDIAPYLTIPKDDYIQYKHQYVRALYMKDLPAQLSNEILKLIMNTSMRLIVSVDARPISKQDLTDLMKNKYLAVEGKIRKQQQRRNKNKDFSSEISYQVQEEKKDIVDMMNDVKNNDTNYAYASVTVLIMADSLEELEQNTQSIKIIAKGESVYLEIMKYRQVAGVNTALPIGKCQWYSSRLLSAGSLSVFFPFRSQELLQAGGNVYGINSISKNIVQANRKLLMNGNGWVFGGSGAGKSVFVKDEIVQNLLRESEKNEVIILDPNNEYRPICDAWHGAYVDVKPGSETRINGFDQPRNRQRSEYASGKFGWTIGVLELLMKRSLTAVESAYVEKSLLELYAPYMNGAKDIDKEQPSMYDFQQILKKYPDTNELVISLERLITGSFNMFGQKSTVDSHAKVTVYGFQNVSKDMFGVSNFIIMESLQQRCFENYQRGVATWIYVDEGHEFLKTEQSANYMQVLWRELRKNYGFCTGITHEVADICSNDISRAMITSSSFIMLLRQDNIAVAQDVFRLNPAELDFIANAERGCGLLKCGKTIVPIDNKIPKNSELYKLINTDPENDRTKAGI